MLWYFTGWLRTTRGVCGYFSRGMMQSVVMATGEDLGPPVGCVGYCQLEQDAKSVVIA